MLWLEALRETRLSTEDALELMASAIEPLLGPIEEDTTLGFPVEAEEPSFGLDFFPDTAVTGTKVEDKRKERGYEEKHEAIKTMHVPKVASIFMDSWEGQTSGTDTLRASGIYFTCPREFVLNYWQPKPQASPGWSGHMMMGIGTYLHSFLQNCVLGPMGILHGRWQRKIYDKGDKGDAYLYRCEGVETFEGFHPEPEKALWEIANQCEMTWTYMEDYVWSERWRIAGHTDGNLSNERLNYLYNMAKYIKKEPKRIFKDVQTIAHKTNTILEVKTSSGRVYEQFSKGGAIADYYKQQAIVYQKLKKIPRTMFWYIDRATMDSATLMYKFQEGWWTDSKRKARTIWESIRDEKLPESSACTSPTDTRAKSCTFAGPCFSKHLKFENYVKEGKLQAEKSGRKLLDLAGRSWSDLDEE